MASSSAPHGLAVRVREATALQHKDAESRSFITRLMGGELDLGAYTAYLAQFAYIYEALEAREARDGEPAFVSDPALHRFPSICSDLTALGAADWRRSMPADGATLAYVEALHASHDSLPRYVAHHYTRYLGDLSGGQAIAALVARHYGATEAQLGFYRFDQIDSPVVFKRAYRDALDSLDLTLGEEDALIDEARRAFDFNAAIFDALADRVSATARAV